MKHLSHFSFPSTANSSNQLPTNPAALKLTVIEEDEVHNYSHHRLTEGSAPDMKSVKFLCMAVPAILLRLATLFDADMSASVIPVLRQARDRHIIWPTTTYLQDRCYVQHERCAEACSDPSDVSEAAQTKGT